MNIFRRVPVRRITHGHLLTLVHGFLNRFPCRRQSRVRTFVTFSILVSFILRWLSQQQPGEPNQIDNVSTPNIYNHPETSNDGVQSPSDNLIPNPTQQQSANTNDVNQFDAFLVRPTWNQSQLQRLPNLSQLHWPETQYAASISGGLLPSGSRIPKPGAFKPVMTPGQRECYLKLLETFTRVMLDMELGDRFWIHAGTLVGSIRHHDLLPWDDDIDVVVDWEVKDKLFRSLRRLKPEYRVRKYGENVKLSTKFLTRSKEHLDLPYTRRSNNYAWGWPFMDISFYKQNGTHILEFNGNIWPRDVVFPLLFRPLGIVWYPMPNSPLRYLEYTISIRETCKRGWNHIFERDGPSVIVNCSTLAGRYAFVERKRIHSTITQSFEAFGLVMAKEQLILETRGESQIIYHTINLPVNRHEANVPMYV